MRLVMLICLVLFFCQGASLAKSYDVGIESQSSFVQAKAILAPEPKIPPSLQEECLNTSCIARFSIKADGSSSVKLLTSSGCDEIDELTLKTLERWKFSPATIDGKAVASKRKIKIEFEID